MSFNRVLYFVQRPETEVTGACFELRHEPWPEPREGKVLVQSIYASVDPYMRGRMSDGKSYADPFPLNTPMQGGMVGRVLDAGGTDLVDGDWVSGVWAWADQALVPRQGLRRLDAGVPPTTALHVWGMTGLTAYIGLTKFGRPEAGQTLVVSAAAGAVGSLVGQIGRILGLTVVGIAGRPDKCQWLTETVGLNAALNYRDLDFGSRLAEVLSRGVDVYFDNVGGPVTDQVMAHLNPHARIVICGQIARYNGDPKGFPTRSLFSDLLVSRAEAHGFIISEHQAEFKAALEQLVSWYQDGRLVVEETILEGFEELVPALIGLFHGQNRGKAIVKIS